MMNLRITVQLLSFSKSGTVFKIFNKQIVPFPRAKLLEDQSKKIMSKRPLVIEDAQKKAKEM